MPEPSPSPKAPLVGLVSSDGPKVRLLRALSIRVLAFLPREKILTLNITLLTPIAIYQSADFRLTDPADGSLITDESAKMAILQYPSWSGFLTYTGLGSCYGRHLSDIVAEWLTGMHGSSMAEVAARLEQNGTSLLNQVRKPNGERFKHTFTLAGFEDNAVRAFVISNFEDRYGRTRLFVDGRLTSTNLDLGAESKAAVIVTGRPKAVPNVERHTLSRLATIRPEDGGLIRRHMHKMNAKASTLHVSGNSVSRDCAVVSFHIGGLGKLQMGIEGGPRQIPMILNGVNTTALIAELEVDMSNAKMGDATFVSISPQGPGTTVPSNCKFPVEDTDSSGGYEIVEVTGDDFFPTYAYAINDAGDVVGTGREEDVVPWFKNVPWIMRNGQVAKLDYHGHAFAINNGRRIAAMPEGVYGDGVAIYSDGTLFVFPIFGPDVASVAATRSSGGGAINSDGIVAGNVCTQTGQNMRAAVFRESQPPMVLVEPAAKQGSRAVDINDRGQVLVLANVATFEARSILWNIEDNTWSYVGGDNADVLPVSVTNDGLVLGSTRGEGALAVICKPGGTWEPLGTSDGWTPSAINDTGDAVGTFTQDGLLRPWLRLATGEHLLLPYAIGHHTEPKAINDVGDIVGTAQADHGGHAVVWRPG